MQVWEEIVFDELCILHKQVWNQNWCEELDGWHWGDYQSPRVKLQSSVMNGSLLKHVDFSLNPWEQINSSSMHKQHLSWFWIHDLVLLKIWSCIDNQEKQQHESHLWFHHHPQQNYNWNVELKCIRTSYQTKNKKFELTVNTRQFVKDGSIEIIH